MNQFQANKNEYTYPGRKIRKEGFFNRLSRGLALKTALKEREWRIRSNWINEAVQECTAKILSQNNELRADIVWKVIWIVINQFELDKDSESFRRMKTNPLGYRIDGNSGVLEHDLISIASACSEVFGLDINRNVLENGWDWKVIIRTVWDLVNYISGESRVS